MDTDLRRAKKDQKDTGDAEFNRGGARTAEKNRRRGRCYGLANLKNSLRLVMGNSRLV
jgi:hypothetical protein